MPVPTQKLHQEALTSFAQSSWPTTAFKLEFEARGQTRRTCINAPQTNLLERDENKDNIKGDVCSAKDACTNELSKDSQVFGLKKVIWSCVDMRRCQEQSALTWFHIATVALFLCALDASSGAYPLILGHGLWPGAGRGVNGRKFNQNTLGSSIITMFIPAASFCI